MYVSRKKGSKVILLIGTILICSQLWAQRGSIRGKVVNDFTKESVPFASIYWKKAGTGTTSDSAGNFIIKFSHHLSDTLVASYVGFVDVFKPFTSSIKDTTNITLVFHELKLVNTVEVKSKFHKGQSGVLTPTAIHSVDLLQVCFFAMQSFVSLPSLTPPRPTKVCVERDQTGVILAVGGRFQFRPLAGLAGGRRRSRRRITFSSWRRCFSRSNRSRSLRSSKL